MSSGIHEALSLTSVAVCGLAIAKGGPAERWGGGFILSAWTIGYVSQIVAGRIEPNLATVTAAVLWTDILLACGFLWLALRFSSLWLAAAMMLQAFQLALYGSFMAGGQHRHTNDYAIASNIQSGLLLLAILGGTLMSWRRRVAERREASNDHRASLV